MQKIVSSTLISAVETSLGLIFSISTYYLLTSNFGFEALGIYAFLSIFTLLGAINLLDFGIEGYLINRIGKRNFTDIDKGMCGIFLISTVSCIIFCLVIFYAYRNKVPLDLYDLYRNSALFILVTLPIQYLNIYLGAVLQGLENFKFFKANSLLATSVTLSIVCICTYLNDLDYLAFVFILTPFIRFTHYIWALYRELEHSSGYIYSYKAVICRSKLADSVSLIVHCRHLFLARITGFFFGQTDKLIISVFLSVSDLGVYDLAKKMASPIQSLSSILLSGMLPRMSFLGEQISLKNSVKWIEYYVSIIGFASLTLVLAVSVLSKYIESNNLETVINLFVVFSMIATIKSRGSFLSTVALPLGFSPLASKIGLVGFVTNFVLSVFLLQFLGLLGVSIGTLIAFGTMLLIYMVKIGDINEELSVLPTKEITVMVVLSAVSIFPTIDFRVITFLTLSIFILTICNLSMFKQFYKEFR